MEPRSGYKPGDEFGKFQQLCVEFRNHNQLEVRSFFQEYDYMGAWIKAILLATFYECNTLRLSTNYEQINIKFKKEDFLSSYYGRVAEIGFKYPHLFMSHNMDPVSFFQNSERLDELAMDRLNLTFLQFIELDKLLKYEGESLVNIKMPVITLQKMLETTNSAMAMGPRSSPQVGPARTVPPVTEPVPTQTVPPTMPATGTGPTGIVPNNVNLPSLEVMEESGWLPPATPFIDHSFSDTVDQPGGSKGTLANYVFKNDLPLSSTNQTFSSQFQ
jgi:hypothetical protein